MHRVIWALAGLVVALAIWLWGLGGADQMARLAAAGQREAQEAMAGALRALRAGEPGAIATLLGLCFAYGFFHAAGPGHGKLVIGGYGVAQRVPVVRLSVLAVASSVAQAVTAVVLVYAALLLLDWGRQQMVGVAEDVLAPLSFGLIAAVGLWLAARGLRRFLSTRQTTEMAFAGHASVHEHDHSDDHVHHHANSHDHGHNHTHDHTHDADGVCASCGHKHGPTLEEAASVRSVRDALMVVGSVAIRPCTGAIFILILTWQMGIPMAGIAGAFAMALGTACVTVGVALAAVSVREGALMRLQGTAALRATAVLELMAGLVIALVAMQLAISLI